MQRNDGTNRETMHGMADNNDTKEQNGRTARDRSRGEDTCSRLNSRGLRSGTCMNDKRFLRPRDFLSRGELIVVIL